MKKYLSLLFTAAIFLFAGCTNKDVPMQAPPKSESVEISQSVDTYFIDGSLEDHAFTATQRVNYVNKENQPLSELYFHLYPNIYQDKNMFEAANISATYPDGFNKGGIEIYEVSVLGMPLNTEINDKLLKINLNVPLAPTESLIITFKYKTTLPKCHARMGYYDDSYSLTGFYPVAAVYDDGWKIDEYNNIGDPFFTDIADYHITLRLPSGFTVASTGEYTSTDENGRQVLKITAGYVREAAIVAGPDLKLYEDTVDGITVKSYAKDETFGLQALSYAKDSLAFYNSTFGKYPYSQLSVVDSSMHGGGMEYPNLVLISEEFYKEDEQVNLEWIVAHEIAHQWWYGLVGSDPVNDSFVDESLTEFSTLMYTRNKYDEETFNERKNHFFLTPYSTYRVLLTNGKIHKDIMEYETSLELSMLVYIKGCMMYMDMENIMGKEKLESTLRSYYETYAFSIASADDLKNHIKSSSDYDWDSFFNKWLYSKEV